MKRLLTLQEHQDRCLNTTKYETGIECPMCQSELQYVSSEAVMLSNPPQKATKCYNCGYRTNVYMFNLCKDINA